VEIEQLRITLKEHGIIQAMNMKEETLFKRRDELIEQGLFEPREALKDKIRDNIEALRPDALPEIIISDKVERKPKKGVQIVITEADKKFFDQIGFDIKWLYPIANQYDFDRFQYMKKFKAFRCYRGNSHIDWISVNDLGLLNVKKDLTEILLKHQPLNKKKQIIKLAWR